MKRDNLAQTWQEKFVAFELNKEYLYQYQILKQLEKVRKAVESENRKNGMVLELNAKRMTFSIWKIYRDIKKASKQ